MDKKKRKRVDPVRWPGVYQYQLDTKTNGRPDIVYYITYKDGPRKIWEKIGLKSEGMTPQIADEIRKERTIKARLGEKVMPAKQIKVEKIRTNRTLDDAADSYFEQRGGSEQAALFDRYRYDKHVKPLLGSRPVSSITVLDIQRVKGAMADKATATIWGALELIRRIANYGKRAGMTKGLNFKIVMPKRDNEVVQYLTSEQAARLLKTLDEWPAQDVANMIRLAMYSGMRRGEIFKLKLEDLDFNNHLITLKSPKGGKTVSIPMNPIAEGILRGQLQWKADRSNELVQASVYVFPNRQGEKRTDSSAADRIKKKAKLPAEFRIFHGLRHHFAVTLANSGEFSIDMIGELLTHKSAEMTKRYAVFLPDLMQRTGQRAAELIQKQAEGSKTLKKGAAK
jgi:integrase